MYSLAVSPHTGSSADVVCGYVDAQFGALVSLLDARQPLAIATFLGSSNNSTSAHHNSNITTRHTDVVKSITFTRNSHEVVTGGSDAKILLWDMRKTKECVHGFIPSMHGGLPVYSLAYDPLSHSVYSAGKDKTVTSFFIVKIANT